MSTEKMVRVPESRLRDIARDLRDLACADYPATPIEDQAILQIFSNNGEPALGGAGATFNEEQALKAAREILSLLPVDPAEVERLRAELAESDRAFVAVSRKLAERDALFARILGKRDSCAASYWFDEIQALLSASAAPSKIGSSELSGAESSAPVGRDEPADMKDALRAFVGAAYPVAHQINKRGHNWSEAYLDEALVLARATLGRMP